MLVEVYERQKRASNIIVLNVDEPKDKSSANRFTEDEDTTRDLFQNVPGDTSNIRVYRLSKSDMPRTGPQKPDYYSSIRKQLMEYNNRGEEETIKYINNVPSIIDADTNQRNQ
ncbi:hypothetical protein JTB14_026637 [Gonioctena quinquepunctata]|nr:hypothetical protein JTB14_026637 [Gonioctena quinquepunctata]